MKHKQSFDVILNLIATNSNQSFHTNTFDSRLVDVVDAVVITFQYVANFIKKIRSTIRFD